MKAIVYLRISSDRTGQEAGVDRQREDCLQRCHDRGWDVLSVEADNDTSATTGKHRPGFEAVLRGVESGATGVVVAWAVDRLQRSRRDEARLYEACTKHGAMLSLVKGADLDFSTAAGRFVADSLGSVARMEVEMKSERQKRAQLQAAQKGKPAGGRRPFGYEPDQITIRPVEAALIRSAYDDVLAGVPLGQIARSWNMQGFTTGQARTGAHKGEPSPWRRDSVRVVLTNVRNIGQREYNGETYPAIWPAIVDESTFEAVRAVLADPARARPPISGKALLTGVALCGVCGATVHAGGGRGAGVRNYRCTAAAHMSRKGAPVDDFVTDAILGRLARPDAHDLLADQTKPDIDAMRTEALTLRGRLDSLALDFAEGELTPQQLRIATERTRTKLADVEATMADASRVDILGALVGAADVEAVWGGLSTGRQRAVVDALMSIRLLPAGRGVRTFDPASVLVTWRA